MPKQNTMPFIDRKKSVTFKLVHRSQQDPLVVDESAPQRVLVEINKDNENKRKNFLENKGPQNYKVLFDNDYNYLQHLTDTCTLDTEWNKAIQKIDKSSTSGDQCSHNHNITLPSSVFESNVEEKLGLLNKAAPISNLQLHVDSEIIAALDDDFAFDDPDNELEDNFIELANQNVLVEAIDEDIFYDNAVDVTLSQCPFQKEETKSRFTEYSISSNVMKRNNQLSILDDKFEKLYADYDEYELGPLNCEEIEGNIELTSKALLQCNSGLKEEEHEVEDLIQLMNARMALQKIKKSSFIDERNPEGRKSVTLSYRKNKWDCKSILNIYCKSENRPRLIHELTDTQIIAVNPNTGLPRDSQLSSKALTHKNIIQSDIKNSFTHSNELQKVSNKNKLVCSRQKNESSEEKKQRKKVVRNERKERRKERKMNILAFKGEKKKQIKIISSNDQNVQGNRIL